MDGPVALTAMMSATRLALLSSVLYALLMSATAFVPHRLPGAPRAAAPPPRQIGRRCIVATRAPLPSRPPRVAPLRALDELAAAADPLRYAFMLPTAALVATSCQLAGIGGAALFSPIFLLVFPLLGPDYQLASPASAVATALLTEARPPPPRATATSSSSSTSPDVSPTPSLNDGTAERVADDDVTTHHSWMWLATLFLSRRRLRVRPRPRRRHTRARACLLPLSQAFGFASGLAGYARRGLVVWPIAARFAGVAVPAAALGALTAGALTADVSLLRGVWQRTWRRGRRCGYARVVA